MFLSEKKKWNMEVKGHKFLYLKRQSKLASERCNIRCDRKQYYGLEKLDLFCKICTRRHQ